MWVYSSGAQVWALETTDVGVNSTVYRNGQDYSEKMYKMKKNKEKDSLLIGLKFRIPHLFFFFNLFIFGCVGSLLPCAGFL